MKLQHYAAALCVMMALIAVAPSSARAQSSDISAMLELLQTLMKQVESLQLQLAALKGEVQEEIKAGLAEGMEDEDIKKIQELLATDPTIYPKGIVSGYYGPLTTEAIKRFQERHSLKVTGVIDGETQELMQEYMKERKNGKFPPGLLTAPGISKKVMERWRMDDDNKPYLDCSDMTGSGPLCKKTKDKSKDKGTTNVSSTTAALAIDSAEEVINDLAAQIASTSASTTDADDIEEAEDELDDAKDKLSEAEKEFIAGDYKDAQSKAIEAEKIATKAMDELRSDDDDDDDDDEDEDDDEDDDDEDDEDED